jgi:predicted neutral ceramidase superfamily lipid hydrolase
MQEIIFEYFLNAGLWIFVFKSGFKGGNSELISLIFFIVSFLGGVLVFQRNSVQSIILSLSVFSLIYLYGLFIAFQKKRGGYLQFFTGLIVGFVKFFVFLTCVTAVAMLIDSVPEAYIANSLVQMILPYAEYIKDLILKIKS